MASTYTTNLRLTKQGDGDNPNTWGEDLNNDIRLINFTKIRQLRHQKSKQNVNTYKKT